MKREQGYTLIEIMVALVVILTLSGAGISGWQNWQQRQRLWQVACQVRNYLVMLRNDANWHRRDRLPRLESEGDGWCLNALENERYGCPTDSSLVLRPEWQGVTVSDMTTSPGFYGLRGTAWPGHLTLKNSAGSWTVVISVWGRIRLCAGSNHQGCQ